MLNFRDYFLSKLIGYDRRSLAKSKELMHEKWDAERVGILISFLRKNDRLLSMRTMDLLEKISRNHSNMLKIHKAELLMYLFSNNDREFLWHLIPILSRLSPLPNEAKELEARIIMLLMDKHQSKIVRVTALQALFDLICHNQQKQEDFLNLCQILDSENVASLSARIRILKKKLEKNTFKRTL